MSAECAVCLRERNERLFRDTKNDTLSEASGRCLEAGASRQVEATEFLFLCANKGTQQRPILAESNFEPHFFAEAATIDLECKYGSNVDVGIENENSNAQVHSCR